MQISDAKEVCMKTFKVFPVFLSECESFSLKLVMLHHLKTIMSVSNNYLTFIQCWILVQCINVNVDTKQGVLHISSTAEIS